MNLFFERRHTYVVDRPLDQVETRLKWIVTRRWDDYSMDVIGKMTKDGSFNITNKWAMTRIKWIENHPAYIRGKLQPEEMGTSIRIITKPNRLFVALFYVAAAILGAELMDMEKLIQLPKYFKIGLPVGFCCVFLILIILFSNRLKRRFEELMQLS